MCMVVTLAVLFLVIWIIGVTTGNIIGGWLHLLLALSVLLLLFELIRTERRAG